MSLIDELSNVNAVNEECYQARIHRDVSIKVPSRRPIEMIINAVEVPIMK